MIRFAHHIVLYFLMVIPLLIVLFIIIRRNKAKALARFGNPELVQSLMPEYSPSRPGLKFVLLMLAVFFLVLGMAGPQFGSKLTSVKRKGIDVIIALDVSNSMLAQDIQPNRLERAKQAISRMVDQMSSDKIGLVVFAWRKGWLDEKLHSFGYWFQAANRAVWLGKRRQRQSQRKVGDRKLLSGAVGTVVFDDAKIANPILGYFANPLMALYWWIVKKVILW